MTRHALLFALISIALPALTFGNGTVSGGVISVPGDFPDIQSAIAHASTTDGDVIEVAPGVYTEAIDFLGKAITVIGTDGAGATTIDATGESTSVVTCANGEGPDSILEGFTITGGIGTEVDNGGAFERHGGGMYLFDTSPTVRNCRFQANTADLGGGMHLDNSDGSVTNCLFDGNTSDSGAGMYARFDSAPILINCTFADNDAPFGFGGGLMVDASSPVIINGVFWGNTDADGGGTPAQIRLGSGTPSITYCCIEDDDPNDASIPFGGAADGNIDDDPLFVNTGAGDYGLDDFSPCLDAGSNSSVPGGVASDLEGGDRFVDDEGVTDTGVGPPPVVDMGAIERQVNSETLLALVPADFPTIQEGINAATAIGGEVVVSVGVYTELIDFRGKAITVRSTDPANPGVVATTIIDGDAVGTVVTFDDGEGLDSILDGFTVQSGFTLEAGAGIAIDNSSPTIRRCTLFDNDAGLGGAIGCVMKSAPLIDECFFFINFSGFGGAVFNSGGSTPTIIDCIFDSNTAGFGGAIANIEESDADISGCLFTHNTAIGSGFGGAIYNALMSSPSIADCVMDGNLAVDGGGIYNADASHPDVLRCEILANVVNNRGGGIANQTSSSPFIFSCLFADNEARFGGGIYTSTGASPNVVNCTFSNNAAVLQGGGVHNFGASPDYTNCIMWDNTPDDVFEAFIPQTIIVRSSDVGGGWPGGGNIDVDPMFANPAGGDYRLAAGSPCIDAGDNFYVPPGSFDLDGNDRIVGVLVDMGAYEFPVPPCAPDFDGNGSVDFSDLLQLLANFGPCPGCPEDIDGDGVVGFGDLLLLLANFGPCP